jgi:hypothetical protein
MLIPLQLIELSGAPLCAKRIVREREARPYLERASLVSHHSLKVVITERAIKFTFTQATFLETCVLSHMDIDHFGQVSQSTLFHHELFSSHA